MLASFAELFGQFAILLLLIIVAMLSKRLGDATRAKPQYFAFYLAITLMTLSIALRILNTALEIVPINQIHESLLWVFIYNGLPAAAFTLGVVAAWHYWSWLLAESA